MRILNWLLLLLALLAGFAAAADDPITALDRLQACDSNIALPAAEEVVKSSIPIEDPSQLFPAAEILFASGKKDEAVFWQWVAYVRSRYQSGIPTGELADFSAVLTRGSTLPINNYALQDTSTFDLILKRVLEWDRDTPNPFREGYNTVDGLARVEGMYRNLEELRMKIAARREQIEQEARSAAPKILETHALMRKKQCRKELIGRAQASRVIDRERVLVVEFVRNQRDVIDAVGTDYRAYTGSYTLDHNQLLPSRYEVTIKGNRLAYAIVDVSREVGRAEFHLACITHTPLGQREVFKDACEQ